MNKRQKKKQCKKKQVEELMRSLGVALGEMYADYYEQLTK